MLKKIRIDDENPRLNREDKNFEAAITILPETMLEEHFGEILRDCKSLKDVPLEKRKEEANKPTYLIRYE